MNHTVNVFLYELSIMNTKRAVFNHNMFPLLSFLKRCFDYLASYLVSLCDKYACLLVCQLFLWVVWGLSIYLCCIKYLVYCPSVTSLLFGTQSFSFALNVPDIVIFKKEPLHIQSHQCNSLAAVCAKNVYFDEHVFSPGIVMFSVSCETKSPPCYYLNVRP